MKYILFLLGFIPLVVNAGQGAEYVNAYIGEWLKSHEYTKYKETDKGVVIEGAVITIDGEIYGVNELKKGELYSVETRLSVKFNSGRKLDDFGVGVGKTPEEGFLDSLNNFCLTTMHPIYSELLDHDDPHVRKESWKIGGVKRNIFLADWGMRGEPLSETVTKQVEQLILEQLKNLDLSKDIHWVKLVVSNISGEIGTLVLTVDGLQYENINTAIKSYSWPKSQNFYMAKVFLVVGSSGITKSSKTTPKSGAL